MGGTTRIVQRKSGQYTLLVERDGKTIYQRAGIYTLEEAKVRASVWRDLCGYQPSRRTQ